MDNDRALRELRQNRHLYIQEGYNAIVLDYFLAMVLRIHNKALVEHPPTFQPLNNGSEPQLNNTVNNLQYQLQYWREVANEERVEGDISISLFRDSNIIEVVDLLDTDPLRRTDDRFVFRYEHTPNMNGRTFWNIVYNADDLFPLFDKWLSYSRQHINAAMLNQQFKNDKEYFERRYHPNTQAFLTGLYLGPANAENTHSFPYFLRDNADIRNMMFPPFYDSK